MTNFQTNFQFKYRPLDDKLYKQKTSDESLDLAFDPIKASQGSAPFKSISDSTSEIEKKLFMFVNQVPIFLIHKKNIVNIYQMFKN